MNDELFSPDEFWDETEEEDEEEFDERDFWTDFSPWKPFRADM